MLRNSFDPKQRYTFVRYGRMSDPSQNPRSPHQQFATIDQTLTRLQYSHWVHLGDYRDDGVSGRYQRKREGFRRLMSEIMAGFITPDLILVDTLERFGRMKQLSDVRDQLYNRHGVLILSADTSFADPTSTQGRVYSMIESLRASEEGAVKAHNVLRGKRDAILLKRWPGARPPFGYRLKKFVETDRGRETTYSILVPHDATGWIVRLAFRTALEQGWGQVRVARFLNEHNEIPDKFKPFHGPTVGDWFDNEIYIGVMVWPKVATDILDDTRVMEAVPEEEQLRIEGYCEPIVPRKVFLPVREMRRTRAMAAAASRVSTDSLDSKVIKAPVPGLTLRYLLTGLVRCGHCGRSMSPNGSGPYTTQAGDVHRYTSYQCPAYGYGECSNGTRVPEQWLRETVVNTLKQRLFPEISSCV